MVITVAAAYSGAALVFRVAARCALGRVNRHLVWLTRHRLGGGLVLPLQPKKHMLHRQAISASWGAGTLGRDAPRQVHSKYFVS